jgi:hypothetical protein
MKTVLTIIILIVTHWAMAGLIGIPIFNIAGLIGAFIGWKSKLKTDIRFIVGVIFSAAGQIYLHSAYMIYVIRWTELRAPSSGFTKYVVWFFCFGAAVGPMLRMYEDAKREANEFPNEYQNPQIPALFFTGLVSLLTYFLFVFWPESTEPFWSWVVKIGYPI